MLLTELAAVGTLNGGGDGDGGAGDSGGNCHAVLALSDYFFAYLINTLYMAFRIRLLLLEVVCTLLNQRSFRYTIRCSGTSVTSSNCCK